MKIDRLLQNTFAQTHDFRPFFMNVYEIHAESRWERQTVCRGDVELRIPEPKMVCRSTSGFNHLRRRVDPENLAFGADQGS